MIKHDNFSAEIWLVVVLTDKVANGLQSLLLTHDESNALLLAVSHELAVSYTSLFPLHAFSGELGPSEKLDTHFHDALEVLFS